MDYGCTGAHTQRIEEKPEQSPPCTSLPRTTRITAGYRPTEKTIQIARLRVKLLRLRRIHQLQQIIQAILLNAPSTFFRPASTTNPAVAANPPSVHVLSSDLVVVGEVKLPQHLGAPRVARSEVDGDGAVTLVIHRMQVN